MEEEITIAIKTNLSSLIIDDDNLQQQKEASFSSVEISSPMPKHYSIYLHILNLPSNLALTKEFKNKI